MIFSRDRILTTHVGSLIRPQPLQDFMRAKQGGKQCDEQGFQKCLSDSVAEVVKQQADAGIDVVSDGEFGKSISWAQYALTRLSGFERRPIDTLSVGQFQRVLFARLLLQDADLVLLDEPFEGLAPVIVDELTAAMKTMLSDRRIAIILVEQHTDIALELTAEAIVLERGAVAHRAPSAQLQKDTATLERLVGLRVAATA